jgi:hypothetical protein
MHAINTIIIKESELRDKKISDILSDTKSKKIKSVNLGHGMVAFPTLSKGDISKIFGENIYFVEVRTNYFGGSGDQSAGLYKTEVKGFKKIKFLDSEFDWTIQPINNILREYGLVKNSGEDEFDTINLGRYRSNEDF